MQPRRNLITPQTSAAIGINIPSCGKKVGAEGSPLSGNPMHCVFQDRSTNLGEICPEFPWKCGETSSAHSGRHATSAALRHLQWSRSQAGRWAGPKETGRCSLFLVATLAKATHERQTNEALWAWGVIAIVARPLGVVDEIDQPNGL